MENGRLLQSMLLDFYGALLTDKQRECYDLHFNEDLSTAEIAEQSGISRQAVWDNIRRADAALRQIEEKTGLIARFHARQQSLAQMRREAQRLYELTDGEAQELASHLLEKIETLEE